MKTEISTFCETCLTSLDALPPALAKAVQHLEKSGDQELLAPPLAALNELRARLRSLVEKLGNQQAYLLIFGPLKSGKSTLMNAISGTYVSEVTSLPGYPCLVYVQNAVEPHFSVTRYNGRETVFANGTVLKDMIADSHLALAQQIRATEGRGEEFDPRTHFSEAIRRIDVKVPVPSLAESSTVLVDTPGLYSRMNFGYDVLTREFRNSAACAVFVVKTDNLFLEQVFTEFNQLLGLFSRIFLVINVDSSKRDLQPDGSLTASAESRDPEQIIEAFRTLSMAGPLRQAYEERRVRIHAVDLMSAASSFLSAKGQRAPDAAAETNRAGFSHFIADLTEYLNSSDYTIEFMRDSLRQGNTLCLEARAVLGGAEVAQLREEQGELAGAMAALDEQIAAVDRLLKVNWEATFDLARSTVAERNQETLTATVAQLRKDLRAALDAWLTAPASLKNLAAEYWNPLLSGAGQSLAKATRVRLQGLLDGLLGGAEPAAAVMTDLHAVEFSLRRAAEAALGELRQEEALGPYQMVIDAERIPVRKSFVDWLLFRTVGTVRRRLFGEDQSLQMTPEIKQQRLGEASLVELSALIEETIQEKFPVLPKHFGERLLNAYVARFREVVLGDLRVLREELLRERAARHAPFEINEQIFRALEELDACASAVAANLDRLMQADSVPAPVLPAGLALAPAVVVALPSDTAPAPAVLPP